MLPWIIAGLLYAAGALNMAVHVSDHPNFWSWKTLALCGLWPFATVAAVFEAATGIELI